jgi:O-antigen/teichoic acid export membrane protein
MPPAFARNTFFGFISGAAVAVGGFLASAIAARLLGAEGMGVIAYTLWCVTIAAAIAGLGVNMVLQRFIPSLCAEGKDDEAEGLAGAAARLSLLAAIVVSLLLFCWLYWPGSSAIETTSPASAPQSVLIGLVLAWFMCWRMADVYLNYLKGEQRFGDVARLTVLSALINLGMIGLGSWLFGVAGALAGYVAGYVVPAARIGPLLRKRHTVGQELRRQVVGFASTSWSAGVVGGLVFGRTEIVFLEHYVGIGAVGLFAVAATVTAMAAQLAPLLLSALLPYLSEQQGLGAHDRIHRMYRTMVGVSALLVVPLCIGIAAIAPVLVPFMFGADFADAAPVASVLLIAAALVSPGVTTASLIYSTGKSGFLLISSSLGLAGTMALGFLLIPRFGLMGAAWSRSIVQVSVIAIETWYVTRRLGFAPPFRAFGAITLAAVIQGAVAYSLATGLGGIASLAVAIPAAVVVYAVTLRIFSVLPMVDPALIDALIKHVPPRVMRLLSRIIKLLSPATKDRFEPD